MKVTHISIALLLGIFGGLGLFWIVCQIVPLEFQKQTSGLAGPVAGLCMIGFFLVSLAVLYVVDGKRT